MKETIRQRLAQLREVMAARQISACIIPGTDPHASEYIAEHWKEREWISGFDGSAGTALVSTNDAALWTDSRYFLQGEEQLSGTGFRLMKQGLPETPEMLSFLATTLRRGDRVAINPQMCSADAYAAMEETLALHGLSLVAADLISEVWTMDRPALPTKPIFVFDTKYAGRSTREKLVELRREMQRAHAEMFLLSALDDIAWLCNIRGKDVDYNPVAIAFALVGQEDASLFIDPRKLSPETRSYLQQEGFRVDSYEGIYAALQAIPAGVSVLVDAAKLNRSLFEAIPAACPIRKAMSPVFKLKSRKNAVELEGIRRSMIKDGVALTRFFMWLESELPSGKLTELSISERLRYFRSLQENFVGESFATIAGYAAHGAIVHYRATADSDAVLRSENLLLLDSGAQFLDGTTDITRTVALGKPNAQQKSDYSKVLKGHIALATAIFPEATRGSQLDILARKALWDDCMNYGHGTGHGVGHFLCVHEGPQNIRMDENPTVLETGMIISNEPGLYRSGAYGIRIENLVHVIPAGETEFGRFLQFETLTLFPIDKELIDAELLSDSEKDWLDAYHRRVYESLSPQLNPEERAWLEAKCSPLR